MKVKLADAKEKLADVYRAKGAPDTAIDWLVELSLDQDLTGNYFSGFEVSPEGIYGGLTADFVEVYEVDKPALKLINGNGKASKLIMKDLLPKACGWAHEQGQVWIGFRNCGYHGGLGTIARKFAEADLVCIYAANGGPPTVPPYGGSKALFGTNPIAYGVPTSGLPIVFDAATSERPFGSIARAKKLGKPLADGIYYAGDGSFTTDPDQAAAIIPFGGHKGSALNILLDVLSGALVGAYSGSLVTSDPDIGAYLQLIDPAALGDLAAFKRQTDQLVKDIESNSPAPGSAGVRVPGYRSQNLREQQLRSGELEVDDAVWSAFLALHKDLLG